MNCKKTVDHAFSQEHKKSMTHLFSQNVLRYNLYSCNI